MKLFGFAPITYDPALAGNWANFGLSTDLVEVTAGPYKSEGRPDLSQQIVQAATKIEVSPIDADGYVSIPDEPRVNCEAAIEILPNTIEVFNAAHRRIFSTHPSVALVPESQDEEQELGAVKALRHQTRFELSFVERMKGFDRNAGGRCAPNRPSNGAALDTLFNKKEWATWSSDRRDVWRSVAWTKSPDGASVVQQAANADVVFILMDEFGSYPKGRQDQTLVAGEIGCLCLLV